MRRSNFRKQGYIEQKSIDEEKLRKVSLSQIKLSPYHRSIGSLVGQNSKGQKIKGTAFMISNDLILTTAHNVYNKDEKADYKNFKFYQAANGIVSKFIKIQSWKYPMEFRSVQQQMKTQYDVALMKLKMNDLDRKNRFCQLHLSCQKCEIQQAQELQLDIYGYPFHESLPNYTPHNKQQDKIEIYQYGLTKYKRIIQINPNMGKIKYKITTLSGQSGSPIQLCGSIIGIHLGGGMKRQKFNVGRLFTFDVIKQLYIWSDQMKAQVFSINNSSLCSHYQYEYRGKQKKLTHQIGIQTIQINQKRQKPIKQAIKSINNNPQQKAQFDETKIINSCQILSKKGEDHINKSQLSKALYCFFQCLQTQSALKGQKRVCIARTLSHIANINRLQGNFSKVIDYYKQSVQIYQKYKIRNIQYCNILNILGCAYYNKFQDFTSSAQIFQKSLKIAEEIQNQQLIKFNAKWLIQSQNRIKEELVKKLHLSFFQI